MEALTPLTWKYKLRVGKELEMDVKREKQQWTATRDDQVVRCECSCDQGELLMVIRFSLTASAFYAKHQVSQLHCICCLKLQHYHCYGFALNTHINEHYCYQCLLEDTHGQLLGDMKNLAIFRRALWILYEQSPSSPEDFSQKLR